MFASKFFTRLASVATILLLAFSNVQTAYAAPPNNDNFADAVTITSTPFTATVDITEATTEAFEPQICWFMNSTVWYSFTPTQNMTVRASTQGSAIGSNLNVFRGTGSGINGLNFLGCGSFGNPVSFFAQAGQTYYLQAGTTFGEIGNLQVNLEQFTPPPPQVSFFYFPSDPSIFDMVTFCSNAFDPGGFGFGSFAWNFGDGATSTDNCASHQYNADGDYAVQHTATTVDGRSASSSQTVQVRTRDVAITRFSIPQTAKANMTKAISVEVTNKRYSDYVQVVLYKGLPGGGEEQIGVLTIFVPARDNRPTTFRFSYTFTSSDAAVGKVVFRAVANIVNGRDVLPADNTAIGTTLFTGSSSYPNP